VVVDKPAGWTSHDVVARCRRLYGQRRVGHSGTLDPGATGILLVGLGRATRLLRFLSDLPKTYVGEVVLGVSTTTLDEEGDVTGRFDMSAVEEDDVRAAATALTGEILQIPPMVSAVHVDGRRLHELARAGLEVERQPRPVTVWEFDAVATAEAGVWAIRVVCSTGTYVRVLAADLGARLGGGAHLRRLRRVSIGPFDLDSARTLVELEADPAAAVLPPQAALAALPALHVDDPTAQLIGHGRRLSRHELAAEGAGPWAVLDGSGALLAVYEADPAGEGGDLLRPAVVLAADG
jgi:tRNA pseudouridine55 synthase